MYQKSMDHLQNQHFSPYNIFCFSQYLLLLSLSKKKKTALFLIIVAVYNLVMTSTRFCPCFAVKCVILAT